MFQRFTERARRAILYAQEEALRHGESFVATEHILLGLLKDSDSVAFRLLEHMGVNLTQLHTRIECCLTRGDGATGGEIKLTPHAKQVIDLAYDEARRLGCAYIGTEHLLLGLVRQGSGVAGRALAEVGVDLERSRQVIAELQDLAPSSSSQESSNTASVSDLVSGAMKGCDLVSISNLSTEDIWRIFRTAGILKSRPLQQQIAEPILPGKTLAMIFEKPSLRTRVTFEVAMTQLGGHAIYLQPTDIRMGERESVADVARNLERWVQGIMIRTFAHRTVIELAEHARIPVINGLSDLEHPCQALADFLTIFEKKGRVAGLKIAYIGDGCNTCHSLMLLGAKLGSCIVVACPKGYEPNADIIVSAQQYAGESGASITIVNDPFEAADSADVIYTDVWASMGLEDEREKRLPIFQPFQVNSKIVESAADDVIVLHCQPAHRGEEITDDVMDGPKSAILDEAENRLHVQKAILALLL